MHVYVYISVSLSLYIYIYIDTSKCTTCLEAHEAPLPLTAVRGYPRLVVGVLAK